MILNVLEVLNSWQIIDGVPPSGSLCQLTAAGDMRGSEEEMVWTV